MNKLKKWKEPISVRKGDLYLSVHSTSINFSPIPTFPFESYANSFFKKLMRQGKQERRKRKTDNIWPQEFSSQNIDRVFSYPA